MTHPVYWLHSRVFIPVIVGRKKTQGLVIDSDGLHKLSIDNREKMVPAEYRGQPYPIRKLRGHLRRMKGATDGAKKLRKKLLESAL